MSRLTGTDTLGLMEAYQAVYAPKELTEEQVWEEVESWVNSLVEEGYDLSDYTWDDLYEYYVSEGYKRMNRGKIERQAQRLGGERGEVLRTLTQMVDRPDWRKHSTSQARKNRAGGAGSDYRKRKELQARDDAKADIKKYGLYGDKKETNEQVELYDIIFSHLLDEGYATTEDGALAIMSNMSEDWIQSIVEGLLGSGTGFLGSTAAELGAKGGYDVLPWNQNTRYTTTGRVRRPGENIRGERILKDPNRGATTMRMGGPVPQGARVSRQTPLQRPRAPLVSRNVPKPTGGTGGSSGRASTNYGRGF